MTLVSIQRLCAALVKLFDASFYTRCDQPLHPAPYLLGLLNARTKYAVFLAVTLAFPLLLLLTIEGALRVLWRGGAYPLFVQAPIASGRYLVANPRVARRWFAQEQSPPAPIAEPFAASKPARSFRAFVLGESSTAGFPFPRNATFSRLLRDVLRDALPNDSVEVINLGIAATNSYAMVDLADEIIAQQPDAVLIYSGHNEWYGALGVGSTETLASRPGLVRLTLALQRWRTFMAIRQGLVWIRRKRDPRAALETASLMETLAREREIVLGGPSYEQGVRQFAGNLDILIREFRDADIPVFVASLASNVRDQKPFASPANGALGGADSAYADAGRLLGRGDTTRARGQYYRARDLDVVRFRAPTAFDSVARAATRLPGTTYVPLSETFASAAPGGMPGHELFLEHVHPTTAGYALIARAFFDAMKAANIPRGLDTAHVRAWPEYERERWLTPFDVAIAEHTRNTLALRWPFVPAAQQRDYRATYRPRDVVDSLAFMVSRGEPWELAKLSLAEYYERRGVLDSAIAEYRGLTRDAPLFETPHRLLGRALVMAGRLDEAETPLRRALAIAPTAAAAHALAVIVLRRRSVAEGIKLLELALRLEPDRPDVLYQLALARGMAQDVNGARAVDLRSSRLTDASGRELPHHVVPQLYERDYITIIPASPLAPGARYRVRLELIVAANNVVDEWEFETER